MLAADQTEISNAFASRADDKFAGLAWDQTANGMPRLEGNVGWVDCTVQDVHEAGDHYLVIGKVEDLGNGDADKPLLFHQGRYRTAE